jgi:hypothetical protein
MIFKSLISREVSEFLGCQGRWRRCISYPSGFLISAKIITGTNKCAIVLTGTAKSLIINVRKIGIQSELADKNYAAIKYKVKL